MPSPDDPVLNPNLGLYLDRPKISMDPRMLSDVWNLRIQDGRIVREDMGWTPFPDSSNAVNLDGLRVLLIELFSPSDGGRLPVFGNRRDLFRYDPGAESISYITPRYETGTVSVTNGSKTVTGSGTEWRSELGFYGGFIHIGATGQTDPSAQWYEIDTIDSDTQITLVQSFGETTASGQPYTARKTFSGSDDDYWSAVPFVRPSGPLGGNNSRPDRLYLTNGADPVVAWDGESDQVYEPDLGNINAARTLAVYKNMLILGNVVVSSDRRQTTIRNSAIGEPENHDGKEAAELVVHSRTDEILATVPLADALVVYSRRTVTLAQFVGQPLLFAFREVLDTLGPIAGRALVNFGDRHVFLAADSQYEFDGNSIAETGSHVWREILPRISSKRTDLALAHQDKKSAEVLWAVPLDTDQDTGDGPPEEAYVEHYLEKVGDSNPSPVTRRAFPATAVGVFRQESTVRWDDLTDPWEDQEIRWDDSVIKAVFPQDLFGTDGGDVFILGAGSQNGGDILSFARTGRFSLGNTVRKGVVHRVYPFVEEISGVPNQPLDVKIHAAIQADGLTTEYGPFTFDVAQADTDYHFVSTRVPGRYAELEFRSEGVDITGKLVGWKVGIKSAGER